MSVVSDIFQGRSKIDFRPKWKVSLALSGFLIAVSILSLFVQQLNPSIDFEGGTILKLPAVADLDTSDIRDIDAALVDARIQDIFDRSGDRVEIQIQIAADAADPVAVKTALASELGISTDDIGEDTIGPTWGDQITISAIEALVFFFIAVALYLAWTLEWKMALAALSAVAHDLIITAGVYSITGIEVSPATVIALLTILGYSLYDTVVVFDKIRENQANPLLGLSDTGEMISHSMNQVLMRSINTTITTVLPVLSMLIVGAFILNAPSLSNFALALFIGLLLGTYSSIFFAAPILVWLNKVLPADREKLDLEAKRSSKKASVSSSSSGKSDSHAAGTIAPRARKRSK